MNVIQLKPRKTPVRQPIKRKRRLVYAKDGRLVEQAPQAVPMLPDLYPK